MRRIGVPALLIALAVSACRFTGQESLAPSLSRPSELERMANGDPFLRGSSSSPRGDRAEAGVPSSQYEIYRGDDSSIGPSQRRIGVNPAGSGYELNFSDAPVQEFTKVILQDTLGLAYVFDPEIQGRVTVSTGGQVSREELLGLLESVLEMNGAALTRQANGYRISPLAAAQRRERHVDYADELRRVGPGYGITVFSLRHVGADTMQRMLRAFFVEPTSLRIESRRNLLLVRGASQERNTVLEVVDTFDVDWMRGQSVGLFPVVNGTPAELIEELQKIFQSEQGGLAEGVIRFQPIGRLNAVLVLTRRTELLDRVASWMRRLDRTNSASINNYVYRVENGKAEDLAEVLSSVFGSADAAQRRTAGLGVAPGRQIARVDAPAVAGPAVPSPGANIDNLENDPGNPAGVLGETRGRSVSPGPAGDARIRIVPDRVNNKLLIRASGRDYARIVQVLREIDRPPLQVFINAAIAEVTLNDNLRYGVQMLLKGSNPEKTNQIALGISTGTALTVAPSFPGLNFLVGSLSDPKVILEALSALTTVKVVSSPSLAVLNNQAATLQVGDDVPVTTRQAVSVDNPLAPVVNSIEFKNTGVILKVTPRVNSSGLVTMEIQQEVSNVVNAISSGATGTLTPTISQRKIASVIAVQSGQTVVLGGLISERDDSIKNKVPLLEEVPFVGDLVGKTDNVKGRTEIVVLLQPVLVRDGRDAHRVAEEVRSRMQLLSSPPIVDDPRPSRRQAVRGRVAP